jgi:hypothetical protein
MSARLALALALGAPASASGAPLETPAMNTVAPVQSGVVIESIDETTVGELGGVRVGMGNVTTGDYLLPDGSKRSGRICSLAIDGAIGVFVGVGSVITVQSARWEVISLEKTPGSLGEVRLRLLTP